MLEAVIFLRHFSVLMASSLSFRDIFRDMQFCNLIQYIVSKKHPVRIVQEVLVESLEGVFNEAHFLVNLRSFFQHLALPLALPLDLPRQTCPPSKSFVRTPSSRQNNFHNSPSLDTAATTLLSIFSSFLNHS